MTDEAARRELIPSPELIVEQGIGIVSGNTIIADFVKIGDGITGNMRRAGILKAEHAVLDVGCGLGRLARPLVGFLTGEYHGLDINKGSVEWCAEHYANVPNFHFYHADVFSTMYNRDAKVKDKDYRFPFSAAEFDFVWSTSLFTHMLIDGVENYIWEMARVMKKGAHCWNTYLLLDDFAENAAARMDGGTRWYMPQRVNGGRVRSLDDTASQVGLEQDRVLAIHQRCGLEIIDIRYGPWSGRTENVRAGGQDVIIARKI